MQILSDISGFGGCSTTANWKALRDASAFIGSDPLALIHFNGLGVYLANRDARAALSHLECGACTDWTR